MNLRVTPEFVFELDESLMYGERIDSILNDIMKEMRGEKEVQDNDEE